MRYLYTFLFYLAMPFVFLRLIWRSRRLPDYRRRWKERLGFVPHRLERCLWVHAVSVGETIAALPLIKALQQAYPQIPLVVTNMTPTGAARVKAALGDSVIQLYVPYDYPDAINRFFNKINPMIAIVMETELWPNLFSACKKRQIPLIVTNARLSAKSARGYHIVGSLTREMLHAVTTLSAQGSADAERFVQLGMPRDKVTITGNLKFDLQLPADLMSKSLQLKNQLGADRLIWVAASTHPCEEEIMLEAHQQIRKKFSEAVLILVPRHPDRFDNVAELITRKGFTLQRRSHRDAAVHQPAVYLGDTMGELLLMYAVCDVAVVAGSFVKIGGHNMLEAAALGKPIITGPELFNFAEISEKLLTANAMLKVHNSTELARDVLHLFENEAYRRTTGQHALQVVEENRGALQKQVDVIKNALK